jgi:uncharacterized repeat protein (TIGR01451 family)
VIAAAVALSLVTLMSVLVVVVSAAPDSTIVVCPAGPPACDYRTIPEGIDAATTGDTVLVHSGSYTEQVTLKSGVVLSSSAGPTTTSISATESPALAAYGVTSATVKGFTISTLSATSPTLGIDILDSHASIADCVVANLQGADGNASAPDGGPAVGVRTSGFGSLTMTHVTIRDIGGGDGLEGGSGGAAGGDALGVDIDGVSSVAVSQATIYRLTGGAAGTYEVWPYDCHGTGGRATGISAEGGTHLVVSHSQLHDFIGGRPCEPASSPCSQRPGPVRGIEAEGGIVELRDNRFSSLSAWAGHDGEPSCGIHTSGTSRAYIERNTITSLSPASSLIPDGNLRGLSPQSFACPPPPVTVVGIGSAGDGALTVTGNALNALSAAGFGEAAGILVTSTEDAAVMANSVRNLAGGWRPAVGIDIVNAHTVDIDGNVVGDIYGEDAGVYSTLLVPTEAGDTVGIRLASVTSATVTSNAVWSLEGGRGTDETVLPSDGGHATALQISSSTARVGNNTLYGTVAGHGGEPDGLPGIAVGMQLQEGAQTWAANNVLVHHGVGVSTAVTASTTLDYNDVWDNGTNYLRTDPGVHDLSLDPWLLDPASGDVHLATDSPLIDAGYGPGADGQDFEQEPRCVDGDDDGTATVDIGADEYWPGLRGSQKQVSPPVAVPGEVLSYRLTLVNPSALYDRPGVVLTDTLPASLPYVDDTLWASGGSYGHTDSVITWTGTVSASHTVTLTFDARLASELPGPKAIVNSANVDDGIGVPQTLRAVALVNPLRAYLPVVVQQYP